MAFLQPPVRLGDGGLGVGGGVVRQVRGAGTVGSHHVNLFVAVPVEKEPGDKEQLFGLSLTTRF
mgnify:CR=1 FL=1